MVLGAHAHASWTLVQADTHATSIFETVLYQADTGQRFAVNDIVETPADGGIQIQDDAGNSVALGHDTRVLLTRDAHIALLRGWVKVLHACSTANCSALVIETARTSFMPGDESAAVIAASPPRYEDADVVFCESGTVSVLAIAGARGKPAPVQLAAHQFATRRAASPALAVTTSPDPMFVAVMPVAFRDALRPLSMPKAIHNRPVGSMRPVDYDDVSDWLESALAVRTQPGTRFTDRFRARLSDRAFRSGVEQHLRSLPEWQPLLYLPPRATPPRARSTVSLVYRSMFLHQ
jgi:hypothetical protein